MAIVIITALILAFEMSPMQSTTTSQTKQTAAPLPALEDALPQSRNPNRADIEYLWYRCCDYLDQRLEKGDEAATAKRQIIDFLSGRLPQLAPGFEATRKKLERRYQRWIESGRKPIAIEDQRRHNSGHQRGPEWTEEDRNVLIARCVERGGRISQGWREALEGDELSAEVTQYYIANPASKSHVPDKVRAMITPAVRRLMDIHHGPRQARLNGAYITRDWSDTAAGDWFQGDDITLNHYFYTASAPHNPIRGQCLLMIDCRSAYALGFALHPEGQYNARIIRSLITRCHDRYGLPRKGFYFERGIWKNARILTGAKGKDISIGETERGLSEYVRFRHADLPRGKVIENVIGILQNMMEPLPGYIGRDERNDCYERVQKHLRLVRAGNDPSELFFSETQWLDEIERVIEKYNDTPQQGRLAGLTPRQAYEEFFTDELHHLDAPFRYLLANHRAAHKVTRNGIQIQGFWYRNEQLSQFIGERVLTWWNPDTPEYVTITDMDRQNPFAVERVEHLPATTATPEMIADAKARLRSFNAHAITQYRIIRPRFTRNIIRQTIGSVATVELGREFDRQAVDLKTRQVSRARETARIDIAAQRLNVSAQLAGVRGRDGAAEDLEKLADFLNEPDTKET
jgi:hypothetical protein